MPYPDAMQTTMTKHQRGFTLIEAVIVIAITGIVAAMVAIFIRTPVQGYIDVERRAEMTDAADTALRRIARDVRLALPNSMRTVAASPLCLEYLPTSTGGRYRTDVGAVGNEDVLDFDKPDASFDILGPLNPVPASGDQLVVSNFGIPGADAYSGVNRATISAATGSSIALNPAVNFPSELKSPGSRFQVIPDAEQAVFYVCTNSATGIDAAGNGNGALYRLSHYGINPAAPAACPAIPLGAPVLAKNVSACAFAYAPVNQRNGLVSMRITITKAGESASLYHQVHVSNVP
ncbi:MAG: type II secretion system protein [Oxalobacteraceae bacterium]